MDHTNQFNRRNFIKGSALAGIGLTIDSPLLAAVDHSSIKSNSKKQKNFSNNEN